MEPNIVSTSTDEATIPLHSSGPSYQEVTDRVLSEYHGGFQDQYVKSLLLGENDSIEDEFCSLNSSLDMTQNSPTKRALSESSQIKVTEKRQKCEDKTFNVKESINQNTIQGIASLQNVRRSQLLQPVSCTVTTTTNTSEEKDLKNFGVHQKRLEMGIKLENMQTIVKSKEAVTSKTVVEVNCIIKEDKRTNKMKKVDQSKCNLCKKKFGGYYHDESKITRHKKLPHHIPCSNCNLMFVDEVDLNKIDKIGLKHHTKYMHNAETTELVPTKYTHNVKTTELVPTKYTHNVKTTELVPTKDTHNVETTELVLQGPTKNVHNAETTGELVPTKDTHNAETRAEVVSNKHLEADDSEEDSNKHCDDILLLNKHLDADASEEDSNKDCDDVELIVVVPKIIKGATSLGRLKIKQYFNIKKEQDDQVDQMNETCMTQENISQDHESYASIERNNTLEVENSWCIENQTQLEENNFEKVNADDCMTTNNNFECIKNDSLLDENNAASASKYPKLPSTIQVQQHQQYVANTVTDEAVVSNKNPLYNHPQNRATSTFLMASPTNLTYTPAAAQLLEKSVGTLPIQGSFPNMGKTIDVTSKVGLRVPNPSTNGPTNSTPIMTGSGGIGMKIPTGASTGTIPIRPAMAGTTGIYNPARSAMAGTTGVRPAMASNTGIYTHIRPSMAGTTGIYTPVRPSVAGTTAIYGPVRPALAGTTGIYTPVGTSVAGTTRIYAPVRPTLAGTKGIYTPVHPVMAGTTGIYAPVRPSMAGTTRIYAPVRPTMAGTTGIYAPVRPSMAGTTGIYTPIRPAMAGTTVIYTPIRPAMAGTTGIYTPIRPSMTGTGTTGMYNRARMANPSSRGTIPINPAMHPIRGRTGARMRGAAGVRFMRGMRQRMPLAHKEAQTRPQVKVPVAPIGPRKLGAPNRHPQFGAPNRPPVGLVQPAVPGRMQGAPFSDIPRFRMTQPVRRGRVGLKTRGGSGFISEALKHPQQWRPVPPAGPGTSGAKATLANTSKPKKVEIIDLSDDDESSPPVPVNPAIARLKNCGISVTKLSKTVPQDARLPSEITLGPVPKAFSSTERTNTESRDDEGNGSNSTLSTTEQTNIPPLAYQRKVNLNTLTPEEKNKLPLTPEQKEKLQRLGLM